MKTTEIIAKVTKYYQAGHVASVTPDTQICKYWYPEQNTACFIGCLLPPEHAQTIEQHYSGSTVRDLLINVQESEETKAALDSVRNLLPEDLSPDYGLAFLTDLQGAHDSFADRDDFFFLANQKLSEIEKNYTDKLLS
jgi:hypothetical protein